MTLTVARTGVTLGRSVDRAANRWRRMKGLLGRPSVEPGAGLIIEPCHAVHTWFMRCEIDVVFLDKDGTVVRVFSNLRPFHCAQGGPQAHSAVELRGGTAASGGVTVGDRLVRSGTGDSVDEE